MNSNRLSPCAFAGWIYLCCSLVISAESYSHKPSSSAHGGFATGASYQTLVVVGEATQGVQQSTGTYTHGTGYSFFHLQTPKAENQTVAMGEDATADIILGDQKLDGNLLSYRIENSPTNGQLIGSPPTVRYVPLANFSGNDQFIYSVSDGIATSENAVIELIINGINDAIKCTA